MSSKNLAAGGLAGYVLGGGLLLVGLVPRSLPAVVMIGGAVLWLGIGGVLLALLRLDRANHRLLRRQAERSGHAATGTVAAVPAEVGDDPTAAPSRDAEPVDARVVGLLDPVAELLRGAAPYSDAPAHLPDDQPFPSLRIRRRIDAPGLRVAIDRYRGDVRIDGDDLTVERLPLDRLKAAPRARPHPAPTTILYVATDGTGVAQPAEAGLPAALDVQKIGDGARRVQLPTTGPGPQDIHTVLEEARRYRLIAIEPPCRGDPVLLAGLVLHLTARGIPCWCPPEITGLLDLLAPELRDALAFDVGEVAADDLLLAARGAMQKRAAWAHHDLRLGWEPDDADAWRPRLSPVRWPPVSVVLTSRRPDVVPVALAMIAEQENVEVEVVVALHGGGDVAAVDTERQRLGLPGCVVSVPAAVPFGATINRAIGLTGGPVVLKWDDDDLYGPRHVEDLLIARRQSGAAMVGKAAEFVYLDGSDQTIWRNPGRAEGPSTGQAGGTFLLDRAVLDDVGGYPEVERAVDHHLKMRLRDRGTTPFRTHGFGFVLRRHAGGHTWEADDERFRDQAVRTFEGLPDVLQLGAAARFAHGVGDVPSGR